jgi:hypothetical protein
MITFHLVKNIIFYTMIIKLLILYKYTLYVNDRII